ncbi:unnamed protein product [Moneuplotes crassus]|uniref:Uncharacterized protein n=1 Tax=Euplotes crassus TaxID=5936 RepID=A0AAD1XYE0_EUPCR|nr:unnamed protein product [Moneuplotes crassus]
MTLNKCCCLNCKKCFKLFNILLILLDIAFIVFVVGSDGGLWYILSLHAAFLLPSILYQSCSYLRNSSDFWGQLFRKLSIVLSMLFFLGGLGLVVTVVGSGDIGEIILYAFMLIVYALPGMLLSASFLLMIWTGDKPFWSLKIIRTLPESHYPMILIRKEDLELYTQPNLSI